jgi:transmembrane sensor
MSTPGSLAPCTSYDAIALRAAEYLEQRRFEGWTDADQAGLDAWLAESPLHRVAYLRLEGAAAYGEELFALERKQVARSSGSKFQYRRFVLPFLAAAAVALIAAFGMPFVLSLMQPPDRIYSTAVGERTTLKFADGTAVDLNTNTAVRFRMTNLERTAWLERGEAWFHVAHDAAHPFAVIAGKDRVTDLGTEFLVRRDSSRMEVALVNGRASLSAQGAPTEMLVPGDDAVATPVSLSVTRQTPQELADKLSWRQGSLVFRDTKLADVVRELNRYNAVKLVIADPSIADLKFNGKINSDNLDDFLGLAQIVMKLRADKQGKDILLSRAAPAKAKHAAHTRAASP